MKVLWFSNTPANSEQMLNDGQVRAGWLSSLDNELQEQVELHVAFYYPKLTQSFKYKKTTYHPIGFKHWKIKAILNRFSGKIVDDENLNRYLEIINKVNPDIIHIHGTENTFGCILGKTKVPIIVTIQGILSIIYYHFPNGIDRKYFNWIPYSLNNNIKANFFLTSFKHMFNLVKVSKEIEIKNLKNAEMIIGRTKWDYLASRSLAPNSKYYHNDEMLRSSFYLNQWNFHNRQNIIIHSTIGDQPIKGFLTIVNAILFLKNAGLNNFVWQVAGLNANSTMARIARKIHKSSFPAENIIYLGNQDENELILAMKNADIFVMASHIENSSNSLCEAMILGMPCVATFAGGTGSLLSGDGDGILIQDNDPIAMAGAILEFCNNKKLAIKYGEEARKKALIRHSKEKIINDLMLIYNNVITTNP
jgi:glycosyltransferase involved in cell wall biosynthesis